MSKSIGIRFVTAASLFDGHDVSINIMRRLLQAHGAEVIHLGHNRSAKDVVEAAIMEDVQGIALSSYQGGHMEYFSYIRKLLDQYGAHHIKIFGGGGGVITNSEIKKLQDEGIEKIYSPEDGMKIGLNGIIEEMIQKTNFSTIEKIDWSQIKSDSLTAYQMAKIITYIEENGSSPIQYTSKEVPVFGITGTGGAGKSSLIDELLLRFNRFYPDKKIALVSVDPTRKKSFGALLGDRIRLGAASYGQFFIRSLATRTSHTELSPHIDEVLKFLKSQDFELILVETSGIGQANDEITKVSDMCLYVMTPEFGAQTQLEKIEMLDAADFIAVNKFEKPKAIDALKDVRKQYRRNKNLFDTTSVVDEDLPIYGTMASHFNDEGINQLFKDITTKINFPISNEIKQISGTKAPENKLALIKPDRINYLREIAKNCRDYNQETNSNAKLLIDLDALNRSYEITGILDLDKKAKEIIKSLDGEVFSDIDCFNKNIESLKNGKLTFLVRGKSISQKTKYESLSHLNISKVSYPNFSNNSDKYLFIRKQNLPGFFPFSAGIFPFKREDEDPKRQFAGEGGPNKTNKRFHFLSKNDEAKRLSTAFDSVTLYGEDPDVRPDIFGKIGESGVSICTLKDMEDLYQGFDLTSPKTSVSMTINGPASIILAMFMNTAIKQKLTLNDFDDKAKKLEVMKQIRGTVQADILKEDQAQNTCIFSLEFALRMVGDVQEYFSKNKIKNYYTISISGYHIAEAGANPITQLAFTLANGFTYVEYFLSRGIPIDDFCDNLSFFFSNGLDPEYTVIGRVARKIWAIAMKYRYGASEKSQKLKYHIQTSGRSLHAQEIDFNDIRTTLQAFLALNDNCNSLHTNAYDEAVTTPTEESVRRAMAIQMIINKEFGLNKTDNALQGSFIVDELSELVEEAVLVEFEKLSDRGGVLGSMENMYQRGKIQEESIYYETLKDSGKFPIIGVNTYIAENIDEMLNKQIPISRSSYDEKNDQIKRLLLFKSLNLDKSKNALKELKRVASTNANIFEELLETVKYCSLGEITNALYEVGGRYRRNM